MCNGEIIKSTGKTIIVVDLVDDISCNHLDQLKFKSKSHKKACGEYFPHYIDDWLEFPRKYNKQFP